jgi:uncharacterized protein YndB with AHSA1/START domain
MNVGPTEEGQEAAVECSIRVAAAPETIFRYLTESDRFAAWMGVEAALDPRPGGAFELDMAERGAVRGTFVAVEPLRRVVFTWGWVGNPELPPGSSTVEVTLLSEGEETEVRLRHTGLPSAAMRELHRAGWEGYLARLALRLAGADPGPDPATLPSPA